jgi:hypothetical protein
MTKQKRVERTTVKKLSVKKDVLRDLVPDREGIPVKGGLSKLVSRTKATSMVSSTMSAT